MWDTSFEDTMLSQDNLSNGNGVVINCPTEELFYMMANILESFGIGYASGENIIDVGGWNEYEDDFCFYVDRTGKILHGPKCSTEDSPYDRYKKCTFYGVMPDFDVASNDEILTFLEG